MLVIMLASCRLSYLSCNQLSHKHSFSRPPNPKFRARTLQFTAKSDNNVDFHYPAFGRMQELVEYLQEKGVIKSSEVAELMKKMDRGLFVPEGVPAYMDTSMWIGYNATISAPHMHATCLGLLKKYLRPGMHALDVGSGSSYMTSCFAMMVGPQGRAVGVEHIPQLVAISKENVKKSEAASLLEDGCLSLHVGDGRLGWPDAAPYNAIHVGAAAPEVPKPLIEQLKPGGRMVIPVGSYSRNLQLLQVIDKQLDGSLKVGNVRPVFYIPLTDREEQLQRF